MRAAHRRAIGGSARAGRAETSVGKARIRSFHGLGAALAILTLAGSGANSPSAQAAAPGSASDAAFERSIARLSAEAQAIEDGNSVKRLQRAYGYYIDKGYWREAADLFAEDATMEIGVDGVYVGRARILELLIRHGGGQPGPGLPFGRMNHHMQLQPVVHVAADGRTAKGRWRELALLGEFRKHAAWGDGIYENEYVKEAGVWKIKTLRYYPNFVAPYEGGWAKLRPVSGDWKSEVAKEFPADRPPTRLYKPFPDVFIPPYHYGNRVSEAREPPSVEPALAPYRQALARLKSRDAIENLQAAYGYYIDKGQWRQAAELFANDATYEFGQRGVYVGKAHIRRALELFGREGLEPGQLNNFMMLQPIIDVAPDNKTAKARWRSDVQLASNGKGRWGEGTYENEYVNDGGVWKISKLHFYVTFMADYDLGWVEGPIPMEGPSATHPPDRPPTEVYESLPGVYLPAFHYEHPVVGAGAGAAAGPGKGARITAAGHASAAAPSVDTSSALPSHLHQALAELSRRIERLEDHNAIEKVQRAYGYYVDKAMWPEVADLFAENGTLEIGGRGVFVGKQRVLEYLVTGLGPVGLATRRGQVINHQQFQGIVTVAADGRTAEGRWTALVMGGGPKPGQALWGDVTYENDYVKENGVWKIAKLRAPFNMYTYYKDGWAKSAVPNTRPDSFPPPPDLPPSALYLTYPSFHNEPFHYPNPVTGRIAPPPHPAAGGIAPMLPLSGP